MSHGTFMSVMSYICMSHGTCMSESWNAYLYMTWHDACIYMTWHSKEMYEWVLKRVCVIHETRTNESRHTYECVMAHVWMCHGTRMKESWITHIFSMTLPAVILLSLSYYWTRVTWLIHVCDTWATHMSDMTHPCWYTTFSVILSNMSIHL